MVSEGVEPWPWSAAHTDTVVQAVSSAQRAHNLALGNALYLGIGRYVYRTVALTAGSLGNLTQVADLGAGQGHFWPGVLCRLSGHRLR